MNRSALNLCASAFALGVAALGMPAFAQDATQEAPAEAPAENAEIIVTGVAKATNRLDTSISVSALGSDVIAQAAPRGTSEIFRRLPGIRSESSAGGGNSNAQVRGLPAVTGGAQFISLQEDGLPVLLFGDHNFSPTDNFVKVDSTLDRIESVRGGSAATLATNGNGAIINLISKTGKKEGGSILFTKGVDYRDTRVDAEYGARIADDLYFHVGGHYQIGGDVRHIGFNAIDGGKIRLSVTKEFDKGFIRVYGQFIDKKDATYMPQTVRITEVPGSVAAVAAGAANYGKVLGRLTDGINGFSPLDSFHSRNLIGLPQLDRNGNLITSDLREGIHAKTKTIGAEFQYDFDGFVINDKIRYQDLSGRFVAPFTHAAGDADTYLRSNFGALASGAVFFNGPNAGKAVNSASLTALTGNNLITELALFDTELNDMGNFTNDLRVTKSFTVGGGELTANVGYFKMRQNFEQTWHWGRFLINTAPQPSLINVPGATENGVYTYNGAFGACCNIFWDLQADVDAAYGGLNYSIGALNLDGSVRHETMRYSGFAIFNSARNVDVNKDGTIGPAERGVPINDPATRGNIGGSLPGTSYSFGANYKVQDDLAVFARYSRGVTWNFDRQFGAFASGAISNPGSLRNTTRQIEAGVKWRERSDAIPGNLAVYLTYFNGRANLVNFSITQNRTFGGIYKSNGVELELNYDYGGFNLFANGAYTDAKAVRDFNNPARNGLRPIRQAKLIYNVGASYNLGGFFTLGGAVNGTSSSFVDFENRFIQPGFATVSAFASAKLRDNLTLGINANNLFNKVGFTEGDESRLFDTNGNGAFDTSIARSIPGRTIAATVKLDF